MFAFVHKYTDIKCVAEAYTDHNIYTTYIHILASGLHTNTLDPAHEDRYYYIYICIHIYMNVVVRLSVGLFPAISALFHHFSQVHCTFYSTLQRSKLLS